MALDVGTPDKQLTHGSDGAVTHEGMSSHRPARTDRLRWVLPIVVVLFAGGLRFAYLSHPERIYFDETYYAENAAQLLDYGVEAGLAVANDPSQGIEPQFVVHPSVGKWLIALGIAAFGDNSLGWRVGRGIAALTAFLLSIEGLALTMSRISMLDIFLALFAALGVWCLLLDRDHRWAAVTAPVE